VRHRRTACFPLGSAGIAEQAEHEDADEQGGTPAERPDDDPLGCSEHLVVGRVYEPTRNEHRRTEVACEYCYHPEDTKHVEAVRRQCQYEGHAETGHDEGPSPPHGATAMAPKRFGGECSG